MKRIAIAGAGCLLTMGLAIFAVALAQRDSRDRESPIETLDPEYAHQQPEPIQFPVEKSELSNPPKNYLRTIAEPLMRPMPQDELIAPLDQAPFNPLPDEALVNSSAFDSSKLMLAAGQEPTPATNPSLVPPPNLMSAPTNPSIPKLPRTAVPEGLPPAFPTNTATNTTTIMPTNAPPAMLNTPPANPVDSPIAPPTYPNNQADRALLPSTANPRPMSNELPSASTNTLSGPPAAASLTPPLANPAPRNVLPSIDERASRPTSNLPRQELVTSSSRSTQLASAAPGARQMDGTQNPSLEILKRAPQEVQVGQPATFAILVRNVGSTTAYEVSVTDSVPRGTRLASTNPKADSRPDGTLVWSLGELKAGSEQVLSVELIPESEGEIGSVASVNFAAQASVRTVSTQPKLLIKQVAESTVLMGRSTKIQVTVTNEGTGVARGVSLEEDVPTGFRHPLGTTLGVPLGDLVPGQSRTTELELTATAPGNVRNVMRAVAANISGSDSAVDIQVVSPQLKVSVAGPGLRYLERQATYQISVTNHGTSMAYNVEIVANLPRGLQYNSTSDFGSYDSSQHAVIWGLEELKVGATATTDLILLPVEEGEFAIRLQSQADGVQSEPFEKKIRIEGQSELAFSIDDDNDPIEVDGQTTYAVTVVNNGTRIDEDVQVMIELPKGAKVLDVKGPVGYKETAQGLLFEPIAQMRAKDRQIFRFNVQHSQNGVHVVRAHLKSKLRPIAVVNEESTEVYRDQ